MSDIVSRHRLEGNTFVAERVQDCEDIIERNKELQKIPQKRAGEFRHTSTIPCVILEKWLNEEWSRGSPVTWGSAEFDELIQKKINDPDWRWLRTD